MSSRGDINPKSFVKVSCGCIIMALFAIIMIYTGGTQAIQNFINHCCVTIFPWSLWQCNIKNL
ncbi:hypothetical protein ACVNPZ_06270 [Staphylococcus aureus]